MQLLNLRRAFPHLVFEAEHLLLKYILMNMQDIILGNNILGILNN